MEQLFFSMIDLFIAVVHMSIGIYFYSSNGKGWKYIAGYNEKSEMERAQYDEEKLCRTIGRRILTYGFLFLAGLIVDCVFPGAGMTLASVLFVVLLIIHLVSMNKNMDSFKKIE